MRVTNRLLCELHVLEASKTFEYRAVRFDTENSTYAVIKVRRTQIRYEDRKPIPNTIERRRSVPELGSKIKTFLMNSNAVRSTFYLLLCETCILFS